MVSQILEDSRVHSGSPPSSRFSFRAIDVTGSVELEASDIQRSTPAGAVARAVASLMDLPDNVPYALRNDRTGAFLEDDEPIGDQVELDSRVVVTPKTHLGSTR